MCFAPNKVTRYFGVRATPKSCTLHAYGTDGSAVPCINISGIDPTGYVSVPGGPAPDCSTTALIRGSREPLLYEVAYATPAPNEPPITPTQMNKNARQVMARVLA